MNPLSLEKSTTVYSGKVITVKKELLRNAQGDQVIREKIDHNQVAAIIPFTEKGNVILIKQYRYALDDIIWEIPAGTCEDNESPLSCAKRELEEETGYKASQFEELIHFFPTPGVSNEDIFIFKATNLSPSKQNLDDDEYIAEIKEFSLSDISAMIQNKTIVDSKTLVALLLVLQGQPENK